MIVLGILPNVLFGETIIRSVPVSVFGILPLTYGLPFSATA
jgi:hypothetical protein